MFAVRGAIIYNPDTILYFDNELSEMLNEILPSFGIHLKLALIDLSVR